RRSARRDGGGRERGRGLSDDRPAPVRHDLHAVHVRQGKPDPHLERLAPDDVLGAATTATTTAAGEGASSASRRSAAASAWAFALALSEGLRHIPAPPPPAAQSNVSTCTR